VRVCACAHTALLASPRVLFSEPGAPEYLIGLLEVLTLSLQHTHQSNHALIRALLLSADLIRSLPRIRMPPPPEPAGEVAVGGGAADESGAAGSGGFVVCDEWMTEWQSRLPLRSIYSMLDALSPRVTRESLLLAEYPEPLRAASLVGVLPMPSPIAIRKYAPSEHSSTWLTQVIWGLVYSRNQEAHDARAVRLVSILQIEDD